MNIKEILENTSLFNGLDDEALEKIAEASKVDEFKKGDKVVKEGDEGDTLMILGEGTLEVYQQVSKHDVKIGCLEKGAFFGEMALLDNVPRSATIMSKTDSKIIAISQESINELLMNEKGVAYIPIIVNIARGISEKLRKCDEIIKTVAGALVEHGYIKG